MPTFPGGLAISTDTTPTPFPNATADLYDAIDGNVVALTDTNDTPIAHVTTNGLGFFAAFKTATLSRGWLKFGSFYQPVVSLEAQDGAAAVQQATAAATSAAASAVAANASLAKALTIGRPGATVPTWWGVFTSANKPTAAEGAKVGDIGVMLP